MAKVRGMSLIEIMVVITLIALVTAAIGVAVFQVKVQGEVDVARSQAFELDKAVKLHRLRARTSTSTSTSLTSLAALTEPPPLVQRVPLDPWGNPYTLVSPGVKNPHSFDIVSRGPDGIEGSSDDVGNWDG